MAKRAGESPQKRSSTTRGRQASSSETVEAATRPAKTRSPGLMERVSGWVTDRAGRTSALVLAVALILAWVISGPLFHFSDTWQLVINTTTTIITFLMVFIIQRAQNKEAKAVNLKLNELIAAIEGSSNRLIDVESLSEAELKTLTEHYRTLVKMAQRDHSILTSHTVEEAEARHERKFKSRRSA